MNAVASEFKLNANKSAPPQKLPNVSGVTRVSSAQTLLVSGAHRRQNGALMFLSWGVRT
jgi:hypothetical protein